MRKYQKLPMFESPRLIFFEGIRDETISEFIREVCESVCLKKKLIFFFSRQIFQNKPSQLFPISTAVLAIKVFALVSSGRNSYLRIRLFVLRSKMLMAYGHTFCVVFPMPTVPVSRTHNLLHLSTLIL